MNYLETVLRRLKEPSTLAGISVIGVLFGLPPGTIETGAAAVSAVASVFAIFLPENSTAQKLSPNAVDQVANIVHAVNDPKPPEYRVANGDMVNGG
jgi:hypothetical protein